MTREFLTSPDFKTAVLANGAAGTSGQVLTSGGAGVAPSWTTVSGGGGGLTHFVESESTASPNATTPVDAFTATDAGYTNIDVALVAKGNGATLAQVPDGTSTSGNKRGIQSTDLQKLRTVNTEVASGNFSAIAGGSRNTAGGEAGFVGAGVFNKANGTRSVVAGGSTNNATAQDTAIAGGNSNTASSSCAFVGGGESNTASGLNSFTGGGIANNASGSRSVIVGGAENTNSGGWSFVGAGQSNTITSTYSAVCGGFQNRANAEFSFVAGGVAGTTRSIVGSHVFPACSTPISSTQGSTQSALLLLGRQTTNATATVLTSNTNAAATTNQVILPNNSAYSFSGEVIAGVTGAGDTARWTIDGAIKRGANAASTVMVGTPTVTMTHNNAGAAAWTVAVTADTTNGGIAVTVTGAAATTIRWVAKIETTEMTY